MNIIETTKNKDLEEKKEKAENHIYQDIGNNYLDEEVHSSKENDCTEIVGDHCHENTRQKRISGRHYNQYGLLLTFDGKGNDSANRHKSRVKKSVPRIKCRRFSALGKSALGTQSIDGQSTHFITCESDL